MQDPSQKASGSLCFPTLFSLQPWFLLHSNKSKCHNYWTIVFKWNMLTWYRTVVVPAIKSHTKQSSQWNVSPLSLRYPICTLPGRNSLYFSFLNQQKMAWKTWESNKRQGLVFPGTSSSLLSFFLCVAQTLWPWKQIGPLEPGLADLFLIRKTVVLKQEPTK